MNFRTKGPRHQFNAKDFHIVCARYRCVYREESCSLEEAYGSEGEEETLINDRAARRYFARYSRPMDLCRNVIRDMRALTAIARYARRSSSIRSFSCAASARRPMSVMYTFTDRGAAAPQLRPENTASVVRSYPEQALRGGGAREAFISARCSATIGRRRRYREFHQFGVEARSGEADAAVDAEIIALAGVSARARAKGACCI